MRALVTGGTGFVGSHLVEALAARQCEITALVRSPGKATLLNQLGVRQVRGDLHNAQALDEAVAGQDVVFHVAGLIAARSETEFSIGNEGGTRNLVAALQRSGHATARLVYVSSMAAGGPAPSGQPLVGHEPPRPVTQYGRSKLAAEAVVRESGLAWSIVRPPMVYGPRDREVLKVFRVARTGVAPVFGDGLQELSAVYAPDLAEALVHAGLSGQSSGRIYYACHPEVFTSADFVRAVGRSIGKRVRILPLPRGLARGVLTLTGAVSAALGQATILTADKANEFFQPAWTGDPTPLMTDTGWRPAHTLEAGLALTAEWYRRTGWL